MLVLIEMFILVMATAGLMLGVLNDNERYINAANILCLVNLALIIGGMLYG